MSAAKLRLVALLVVPLTAFFVFAVPCEAQTGAPVERPEVKVDDRWVYRRMDHRFEPPVLLYEVRVTFVDARAIHAALTRQGGLRESDATWTRDWGPLVAVDDGIVEPKRGAVLQFPLSAGSSHPAAWEMRRPRLGKFHVRHERAVKVVGWEDIEVPAGKFRALKIEAEGTWRRLDSKTGTSGWARNVVWYAPEVRRWVKSYYEDAQGKVGEELIFYVVQ